ncbi:MAG: PAS domain S-box protein [Magnetococcus sp. WYHC-3]
MADSPASIGHVLHLFSNDAQLRLRLEGLGERSGFQLLVEEGPPESWFGTLSPAASALALLGWPEQEQLLVHFEAARCCFPLERVLVMLPAGSTDEELRSWYAHGVADVLTADGSDAVLLHVLRRAWTLAHTPAGGADRTLNDWVRRSALENTSEGFWLIHPVTRETLQVNASLCEFLGYTPEEMLGRTPLSFADAENRAIFQAQTGRISHTRHRSYDITLTHKSGRGVPVRFNATTLFDGSGRAVAAFALVTDLSRLNQAEMALRRSRHNLSIIFNLMGEAVFIVDGSGVLCDCNQTARGMFGLWDDELGTRNMDGLFHPGHPVTEACVTLAGGSGIHPVPTVRFLLEGRRFPGDERFPVEVLLRPLLLDDGERVLASVRDVTESRRREMEIQRLNETLEARVRERTLQIQRDKKLLTDLLDACPDFILLRDPDLRIRLFNRTVLDLVGVPPGECRPETHESLLACFSPAQMETFQTCNSHALETIRSRHPERFELTIPRGNGDTGIFDIIQVPCFREDGELDNLVVFGRDITERRRAQSELETYRNQLVRMVIQRTAILESVAFAAQRFLSGGSWESHIQPVLAHLGAASGATVVQLYSCRGWGVGGDAGMCVDLECRSGWIRQGTDLSGNGIPGVAPVPPFIPGAGWHPRLSAGETITLLRKDLQASEVAALFQDSTALSVLLIPVFSGDMLWGLLKFEGSGSERGYSDIEVQGLRAAASTLGAVIRRRQMEEALTAAEVEREVILENLGIGVLHLKGERIRRVNAGLLDMCGRDEATLVGATPEGLFPDPQAARRALELIGEGLRHQGQFRGDLQVLGRDGVFWARIMARYLNPAAPERGSIWVMDDIRQERELKEALHAAKEAAEEASHAKSDFLANMSHEIRTPMNAILGLAYLCLEQALPEKPRLYIEKLTTAAQSLRHLIDGILDFSKIEAGHMEIERAPFNLREIIDNVMTIVGVRAEEKGLALRLTIDPALPSRYLGDGHRLGQVLLNLLGNAVKFTEQGRVSLSVTASLASGVRGFWLRFLILDTGIGMTPAQRQRLFQSFTQADGSTSRKFGGTGLGLVISQRLVQLMGGDIQMHSESSQGSLFSFRVQLDPLPPSQEEEGGVATAKGANAGGDRWRGARILLVEDNDISRLMARELLTHWGAQVTDAQDGGAALRAFEASPGGYDLILLDIQMPVMDGFETFRNMASLGIPRPPVVVLSANATTRDRERSLGLGIEDFLPKPIDPAQLRRVLEKWLPAGSGRAAAPPAVPSGPGAAANPVPTDAGTADWLSLLEGFRIDEVMRRVRNNRPLLKRLLEAFVKEHDHSMASARLAWETGERQEAVRLVHGLKGAAGNLGVGALQDAARTLEHTLSDTTEVDAARVEAGFGSLQAELERTLRVVRLALEAAP